MDHQVFARVALSLVCGVQGAATLAIDLNRTHATNPAWTRHARFHVVWQSVDVALLSLVAIWMIWGGWLSRDRGFYLAMLLASVSPCSFLIALASRRKFGSALSDTNGIPPARVKFFGRVALVDMNLAAVVAALLAMGIILAIYTL